MKPAKKKRIAAKKTEKKATNSISKITRVAKEAPAVSVAPQKPLVKIGSKIRPKVVNLKAVEGAKPGAVKSAAREPEFEVKKTKIRIIGIGGGGGNIVSEIAARVKKSSFHIANTDFAALRNAPKNVTTFQFGENLTHGLGTGMDAQIAEEAANLERENIKKILEGQDLVIIVASLGGGTGSGAAPVFAQISKSLGNLTYGIFTLPFVFEGAKKNDIARAALDKFRPYLNAISILPNERVFEVVPKATPFSKTLSYINTTLSESLEGLIETIYDTGVINIDFADLRAILAGNGKMAFLNTVSFKKGEEANLDLFEQAFSSPLYPYTIDKARGLLLNIVAKKDLKLLEVNRILTSVSSRIHKDARIIFGVGYEGAPEGEVKVTVLATGCVYDDGSVPEAIDKEPAKPKYEPQKKAVAEKKTKLEKPAAVKKVEAVNKAKVKPVKLKSASNKEIQSLRKSKPAAEKSKEQKKSIPVKADKIPEKDRKIDIFLENIDSKEVEEDDLLEISKDKQQDHRDIPIQIENPVRKNALQVKKEIEMEERAMLEQEKAWEVPAFLRKQKK